MGARIGFKIFGAGWVFKQIGAGKKNRGIKPRWFKRLGGYPCQYLALRVLGSTRTLAIILIPPVALYPMRDALAPLRVLKVWIVPSKSLMVYWYLIVIISVSYWLVV